MTKVVVCLDGLDPEYLDSTPTPRWDEIADYGSTGTCKTVVPTVTNVNNISIVTAAFPEEHGITSNTYYDRHTDEERYMIDPEFLACDSKLQSASASGKTVAALVAKRKLKKMVGRGCDIVIAAEEPPEYLEERIGEAPDIYSGDISGWLFDAALYVIDTHEPDLIYVSTTDVIPHKYEPGQPQADAWLKRIDEGLGALLDRNCEIIATADHGMNQKTHCVDIRSILAEEGIPAKVVRLIKDEHTYHHQNLGGAAYVYLLEDRAEDIEWLNEIDGIDEVLPTETAANRFHLHQDRIGDVMVLGSKETVFGPVEEGQTEAVNLRSHGSDHESEVPYVSTKDLELGYNKDSFFLING